MSNPLHSEQQYLDIAAQERALLDAGSCLPLNARRDQAAEVLKKMDCRHIAWSVTNIAMCQKPLRPTMV